MNKISGFLAFITGLVLLSCQHSATDKLYTINEGEMFLNKSISFSNLSFSDKNPMSTSLWSRNYKIIIYLDSASCTTCAFNDMKKWNCHASELKDLHAEIFIICNHPDTEAVNYIKEESHTVYPLFFDLKSRFRIDNQLPDNQLFHTFVLDAYNRVIWVGSPIYSAKTWSDFKEMLMYLNE